MTDQHAFVERHLALAAGTDRVRVAGDFPGSPVVLRFAFTLDGAGLVAKLVITP